MVVDQTNSASVNLGDKSTGSCPSEDEVSAAEGGPESEGDADESVNQLIVRSLLPSKVMVLDDDQVLVRVPLRSGQDHDYFELVLRDGKASFPGFDCLPLEREDRPSVFDDINTVTCRVQQSAEPPSEPVQRVSSLRCDEDFATIRSELAMEQWMKSVMCVKDGHLNSQHLQEHSYHQSRIMFGSRLRILVDHALSVYRRFVSLQQQLKKHPEPLVFGLTAEDEETEAKASSNEDRVRVETRRPVSGEEVTWDLTSIGAEELVYADECSDEKPQKRPPHPNAPDAGRRNHGRSIAKKFTGKCAKKAIATKSRFILPKLTTSCCLEAASAVASLLESDPLCRKGAAFNVKKPVQEADVAMVYLKELQNHESQSSRQLTCKICFRRFTATTSLRTHYLSHAGIKPFTCPICRGSFTRRHSLNYHLLCHADQSRFSCKICDRRFRHSCHYKDHVRKHNERTPFSCSVCRLPFRTRTSLRRHVATEHAERAQGAVGPGHHLSEGKNASSGLTPSVQPQSIVLIETSVSGDANTFLSKTFQGVISPLINMNPSQPISGIFSVINGGQAAAPMCIPGVFSRTLSN